MARVDTLICGAEGEAKKRLANLESQVTLAAGESTTPPTEGNEGPAAPAAALWDAFDPRGGS